MDRNQVVEGVAERLFKAEKSLDAAFADMATLAGFLPTARDDADLAIRVGVDAVAEVASALSALADSRRRIANAHDQFAVVQRAMGVRTTLIGGGEKNPAANRLALQQVA